MVWLCLPLPHGWRKHDNPLLVPPRHENYYEVSLSHWFDKLRVGKRRFNNFTPPAPRTAVRGDYGMDINAEEEEEGEKEHVDPQDGGFIGDE